MEQVINIKRRSKSYLTIEELEEIRQLVIEHPNDSLLMDKELLSEVLDNSIRDYWNTKVAGEYE